MADEDIPTPTADRHGRDKTSQRSAPTISPPHAANLRPNISRAPASNPSLSTLPPLITTSGSRRTSSTRIPSYASKRLSTFSNTSAPATRSRPGSVAFPTFHSSLSYTLVRDFAYEPSHMFHYGPPPEPTSATSTNVSDFPRRLSDPPVIPSQSSRTPWSGHPGNIDLAMYGPQLPATAFGDGPPWREDDDLLSPVVSTRHRKARSGTDYFTNRDQSSETGSRRASYAGTNSDGSHNYYIQHVSEDDPDGPGGEIISYPHQSHQAQKHSRSLPRGYERANGGYTEADDDVDEDDDNRYSRDYSFSITSPDEEMHGKAIALFDFASENDNELALKEGQVLWVSYRHGEGWLVAKDPSTGEDGLVPESYVRLERDIPGGFGSLDGQIMIDAASPIGPDTPTMPPYALERMESPDLPSQSQYPMVARFTTSSKDLLPHDKNTHTPISSSTSPSNQLDSQLEAVAPSDKKEDS